MWCVSIDVNVCLLPFVLWEANWVLTMPKLLVMNESSRKINMLEQTHFLQGKFHGRANKYTAILCSWKKRRVMPWLQGRTAPAELRWRRGLRGCGAPKGQPMPLALETGQSPPNQQQKSALSCVTVNIHELKASVTASQC